MVMVGQIRGRADASARWEGQELTISRILEVFAEKGLLLQKKAKVELYRNPGEPQVKVVVDWVGGGIGLQEGDFVDFREEK